MDPVSEIRMVWENLALAMAMWAGMKKGLITRAHLPTGRTAVPTDDGMLEEVFNPLELKHDQDLARCVNNQVRGAVTFSAMQAHSTLTQVFGASPLQEVDPELRAARCVMYLLDLTLGEGMLAPVWRCPASYRERFEVPSIPFVLDATALDGKPVYWEDFGGLEKHLGLLEYCAERLEQFSPDGNENIATSANGGAMRQNQLAMKLVDDGPVSAFLEAKCIVDIKAQSMAKDLYARFLEWCGDTGKDPLAQRSFGLQLTKLGFVRKRRGRGRHWWQGVELVKAGVK